MTEIEFILINKKINMNNYYIITKKNDNQINIQIKLEGVRLPFDLQKYNNNFYLNVELFNTDIYYNDNINKIISFEEFVKTKFKNNDLNFVSSIKQRANNYIHIKTMCKKDVKTISNKYETIDLSELKNNHENYSYKYNIVIKPEYLWSNDESYGINFILLSIEYD